uniref:Metallo-beta-lactamase domain-containing protein n=1 Tax=Grammatophora oceanica TaxID=210454 RepID=A0A7S1VRY0_9STRA|mmetsp:Transcript_5694/g.8026  ORF Transcript_5694/g.8026 Transcript_5694/m.8026 type:complete len:1652 (+) Transcript_5694:355-5310(+)
MTRGGNNTNNNSMYRSHQQRRASSDDMGGGGGLAGAGGPNNNIVYGSGAPPSSSAMRRATSLNETANHHRRFQRASMTGAMGNATWSLPVPGAGGGGLGLSNSNSSHRGRNAFMATMNGSHPPSSVLGGPSSLTTDTTASVSSSGGAGGQIPSPTSYFNAFSNNGPPAASVFDNTDRILASPVSSSDRLPPLPLTSPVSSLSHNKSGGVGNSHHHHHHHRNSRASSSEKISSSSNNSHNMVISPSAGLLSASAASSARARRRTQQRSRIYDDPAIVAGYNSVPLLRMDRLPRGGISLETKAIGRIQFGIPPETIKDSMSLGIGVPRVYIVPVERFSREMGPALGINLAEFEFPAYFNYFVKQCQCTLLVDSLDAEENIRRVFGETFLGPAQFRNHDHVHHTNEDEDFDPSFPRAARPNFYKEFYHFRTAEASTDYEEMTIDTLIEFCHFKGSHTRLRGGPAASFRQAHCMDRLGVPPTLTPDHYANAMASNTLADGGEGGGVVGMGVGGEDTTSTSAGATARRHTTFVPDMPAIGTEDFDDSTRLLAEAVDHLMAEDEDDYYDDYGGGDSSVSLSTGPPLRRTMSDPDLHARTTDGLMSSTASPMDAPENMSTYHSSTRRHNMMTRRGSMDSTGSFLSRRSRDGMSWASGASFMLASDDEDDPSRNSWMYSQAKWLGDVATVYPPDATEEQKATNSCARVEIFKMTGGTEYIIHDVDENNIIVGKARFSGTVRVPDEMAVEGFLAKADVEEEYDEEEVEEEQPQEPGDGSASLTRLPKAVAAPTFHPPSFGVTVLGNSHGFDKNGSVSGYVLWVNGRGIMIDPPPYSSATLEREGIRPQMIMAIIITHCHADHDAGTFQKVMTGSRVAIITTPTIYKSFIRKYAALSGLSPTLLRHSHRHRPAIVGQQLKFQGAIFEFTYTLHTIPCIAFRVEWRGRSMVFTGDHLNSPKVINNLENLGVFTKARADDLRRLPLQPCDVLLHEAGVPPIHTPISELRQLPEEVKKRLYVVHTSAIPKDSGLKVAPTGTARTIRLDENMANQQGCANCANGATSATASISLSKVNGVRPAQQAPVSPLAPSAPVVRPRRPSQPVSSPVGTSMTTTKKTATERDETESSLSMDDFREDDDDGEDDDYSPLAGSASELWRHNLRKPRFEPGQKIPRVFLRPTCVSDAWFILNLLSNVPFLSSLSYANTMEVLEIAMVEMYCAHEVVISAHRRPEVLCVVWEGTCIEREPVIDCPVDMTQVGEDSLVAPDDIDLRDVIVDDNFDRRRNTTIWHAGDWTGPLALQPDTARSADALMGEVPKDIVALSQEGVKVIMLNMKDLHQILKSGSKLFRKYLVLQEKQAAEEAAIQAQSHDETGLDFGSVNGNMDSSYDPVGEVSPTPRWYNSYDSVLEVLKCNSALGKLTALQKRHLESLAEGPRYFDANSYLWQVGKPVDFAYLIVAGTAVFANKPEEPVFVSRRGSTGTMTQTVLPQPTRPRIVEHMPMIEEDRPLTNIAPNSEYARLEIGLQLRVEEMELDAFEKAQDLLPKEERMRNARDRFANKVLARLYSRRAYTNGLVFSRGHLLSDTSRMVSGSLAHIHHTGRQESMGSMGQALSGDHHCHTSNMAAGAEGCVVLVFPRSSLVQFLDGNPGVLLSLLGTQVVV